MGEGPDLDLGLPVDVDEDSDNSAVHVQGLNDSVTLDGLADICKPCGVVKMNKRTGQPMIHTCLDKETGKPKGDATVSCEDLQWPRLLWSGSMGKIFKEANVKFLLPERSHQEAFMVACHLVRAEGASTTLRRFWWSRTWDAVEETGSFSPRGPGASRGNPSWGVNV